MNKHEFHPESLMMSYGFDPSRAMGAVKSPVYQTSTFTFSSAEEGKAYFELAYGLREPEAGETPGMIYSRLDNPNLRLLEKRLTLWDGAADGAVFESGMAAISTVLLEFLQAGDVLLYGRPLYGGTVHLIDEILPRLGIEVRSFDAAEDPAALRRRMEEERLAGRIAMIYLETPANPTNTLVDIAAMRDLAGALAGEGRRPLIAVDNTYLGPLWQHPLRLGADLVLYSATKYIGGHSDLIAGAVVGDADLIGRVKNLRTFLGNMASPWTCWLLLRSLETLKLRMEQQTRGAERVARFLAGHPLVERVHYLGLLTPGDGRQYDIYRRQCLGPGAMISFDIRGGEAAAFAFLNHLHLVRLAVSLGSTESLAQHPATMTHAGIPPARREAMGIGAGMVRLSVGVEHPDDLIRDIEQALAAAARMRRREQAPAGSATTRRSGLIMEM